MAHTKVDDQFHEDDPALDFTKPPKARAERTFYVGRVPMQGWDITYAFSMKRRPDGGISIRDVQSGQAISEQERHRLMAHFGGPLDVVTGGTKGDVQFTVNKKLKRIRQRAERQLADR